MSVNIVALAGVLQAAPEVLSRPSGESVGVKFVVVTTERFPDESAESGYREVDSLNHIRVMDPDAIPDLTGQYAAGDFICVRGHWKTHTWTQGDEKRTAIYVVADEYGRSLNVAVMKGNLGADPELKPLGDTGRNKVRVRLATNIYVRDLNGGEGGEETYWVAGECFFQKKAQAIATHFTKGDEITIVGRYAEEVYTDKETQKPKTNTYLKIQEFDFGKKRGGGGANVDGQPPGYGSQSPAPGYGDLDDEIPF